MRSVARVIEISAQSTKSFEDAIQTGLAIENSRLFSTLAAEAVIRERAKLPGKSSRSCC